MSSIQTNEQTRKQITEEINVLINSPSGQHGESFGEVICYICKNFEIFVMFFKNFNPHNYYGCIFMDLF